MRAAAERAASAAQEAAAIQRAGLEVDFKTECTFLEKPGSLAGGAFRIENVGATVYVHSVTLDWLSDLSRNPAERILENHEFPIKDGPWLMHRDDTKMWGLPEVRIAERPAAGARLTYSFQADGDKLQIRRDCSIDMLG